MMDIIFAILSLFRYDEWNWDRFVLSIWQLLLYAKRARYPLTYKRLHIETFTSIMTKWSINWIFNYLTIAFS